MRVKELAGATGVDAHTIRYYSRLGLLAPERNPGNGYRRYAQSDIERLLFIRQAKYFGFTLLEIDQILREADNETLSAGTRSILRKRSDEVRISLIRLEALRIEIESILDNWEVCRSSKSDQGYLHTLIVAIAKASESGCVGLEFGAEQDPPYPCANRTDS